eukprot:TRINITY_DN27926_c0_g1_i1.p1 TRINITY_DN27926_c0_g1~~TRINITY_DN27926_c0_g1_i1.p1  ORF type:complete len:284 (+),score=44.35 TRINITY_DN27926_c0_g1_i1:99-950(+)
MPQTSLSPLKSKARRSPKKRSAQTVLEAVEQVREENERQHWQSCGRQITSLRPTQPSHGFGFRATQVSTGNRITWEQIKIWMKAEKSSRYPGPGAFDPRAPLATPSIVLPGWTAERRFPLNDDPGPESEQLVEAHKIWAATEGASKGLAAYPAPRKEVLAALSEPSSVSPASADAGVAVDGSVDVNPPPAQRSPALPRRLRHVVGDGRLAGGTFGSSNLGMRFEPSRQFSRPAPCLAHHRLQNFRQRRAEISDHELLARKSPVELLRTLPERPEAQSDNPVST